MRRHENHVTWSALYDTMDWYATSATAKMCGGLAVRLAPMYILVYYEEKRVENIKKHINVIDKTEIM